MESSPAHSVPAPRSSALDRAGKLTRRLPNAVLLGVLVAVIAALNVWWLTQETRPPHWDMGRHLAGSLLYLREFSVTDPSAFLYGYLYYPPLVYWVTDAFYATFGSEAMWVAILSNIVWLAVLVYATYGIGRRLWNARVGWLSVAFVVTAPMVVSSAKEYMLDVPLTAVSALALYLLIRADGFSTRRHSLLFGAACGCGLLVKWTFPLVIVFPFVHSAAKALAEARQRGQNGRLRNLGGAAALTLAVAGLWYARNIVDVVSSLRYYAGPEGVTRGNPKVASIESALWYLWNLVNTQLYLLPFLFVVAGVVFCIRRRELAARNLYPILMVAGTYVMFTLLRHKDARYTLPMLPALAVVATSWLEYVSARLRTWAAAVFVAYGAIAFLVISFGTSMLPENVVLTVPSTSFSPSQVILFGKHGYIIGPPSDENWHQADPFKTISKRPQSERSYAFRGPTSIWFNLYGLDYYAFRYDVSRVEDARRARFLIERRAAAATPSGYMRVERWRLPDGGTLALYERG